MRGGRAQSPAVSRGHDNVACVVAAQGRLAEAETVWKEMIASEKSGAAQRHVLARLRARYATLLGIQQRWSEAINQLDTSFDELKDAPERFADAVAATQALLNDMKRRAGDQTGVSSGSH